MNFLCLLGFHVFDAFYIETEGGEKIKPNTYIIMPSGTLTVYKRCGRCGKYYGGSIWGDVRMVRHLRYEE